MLRAQRAGGGPRRPGPLARPPRTHASKTTATTTHPHFFTSHTPRKHAWGDDEVDAASRSPLPWFRLGLTIVDCVDTLLIAGLEEEYLEVGLERAWGFLA